MSLPVYTIVGSCGLSIDQLGIGRFSGPPQLATIDVDGHDCLPLFSTWDGAENFAIAQQLAGTAVMELGHAEFSPIIRRVLQAGVVRHAYLDCSRVALLADVLAAIGPPSDTPAETSPTTDQSSQPREHLN